MKYADHENDEKCFPEVNFNHHSIKNKPIKKFMNVRWRGKKRALLVLSLIFSECSLLLYSLWKSRPVEDYSAYPGVSKTYLRFKDSLPPLKFYKYDISSFTEKHRPHGLPMDESEYYVEVFEELVYEALERSPFRVFDPEKADLFYANVIISRDPHPKVVKTVIPWMREHWPYYDRYGGVDHIFIHMVFFSHFFAIGYHEPKTLPVSITVPDLPWEWINENTREAMRFTVVPYGSITPPFFDDDERNISAFFIGDLNPRWGPRHGPLVRQGMASVLSDIRDSVAIKTSRWMKGSTTKDYNFAEMIRHSNFCTVPYGDSPSSKRLFDALRSGCLPIVMSDEIRLPFEDVFGRWENCVIQIPMYKPEKIPEVMMLVNDRWAKVLRSAAKEVFPLTDFSISSQKIVPGGQIANWMWCEFFKACHIASMKRKQLLQCKYL